MYYVGSERFGMYKSKDKQDIGKLSQRIKTRGFIDWFLYNIRQDSGIEWLCYIDDDMYVNIDLLNIELAQILAHPPPTCVRKDRCVVADVGPINFVNFGAHHRLIHYSNAVWCMPMETVQAVHTLFQQNSDVALGWHGDYYATVSRQYRCDFMCCDVMILQ
jgi:hypothetical protein